MEWLYEIFTTLDWQTILGWTLVVGLFVVGMLGAVFPILPSVFAIVGAILAYGFFFSFEPFGLWFWVTQAVLVLIIIVADYLISSIAVKRVGGSSSSVAGTNVGLILGPFLIPVFGFILGPFIGSMLGEMKHTQSAKHLLKVGIGSVVGFVISMVVKLVLQLIMIILFIIWLWMAPDLTNSVPL
jgi:uncharacterized protein YqgC (DUF456 family)